MVKLTNNPKNTIKIISWITIGIIFIFLVTIPWRKYVFNKNISQGDDFLTQQKYTDAYVKYQKAGLLKIDSGKALERQKLAKDSAKNALTLKPLLAENHNDDLLKLITDADSKICRLDTDRTLIEKNLAEIATINLEFCANNGPKDYQSWIFLGLANLKLADSSHMFAEFKPGFRQNAADAFAKAYLVDPINKSAIEYSISVNKILSNQSEVDRWQTILDNLNKISK
ncbi:MAG: hypothetical protein NTY30_00730 [Candidatus Berkelbacteria bacterium]|nr:hypothetical protein [Candidatus Berkelbacteria bacterium]